MEASTMVVKHQAFIHKQQIQQWYVAFETSDLPHVSVLLHQLSWLPSAAEAGLG